MRRRLSVVFLALAAVFALSSAAWAGYGPAGGCEAGPAETVEFSLESTYAGLDAGLEPGFDVRVFQDESAYVVGAGAGRLICDGLAVGDVVRTSDFNGVYMTGIPYDGNYDAGKDAVIGQIRSAYRSFDLEHPEVFWLGDTCKVRIMTSTDPGTGAKTAHFFLVLADSDGFAMLSPEWRGPGSITAGIARRDAAVSKILGTVTADDDAGKIRQLNRWLTEHNQYNTTPDLTTIGNGPHGCLSALEGRTGTEGPVCRGYARAFKVLCDELGIPCVLETGMARFRAGDEAVRHMWDLVRIDGAWYGVDVTWCDPSVRNTAAAVSGKENEDYLLVGASTAIHGRAFSLSHEPDGQAGVPALNPDAYAGPGAMPFVDVPDGAYYYDGVLWAADRGIVAGTGVGTFGPDGPCTRAQILTFLWRAAGSPSGGAALPFELGTGLGYAGEALRWAYGNGMIAADSAPDAPCTRADAVRYMWQAAGSPDASGSGFADVPEGADCARAVAWAVARGITGGTGDGLFSPDRICTRAQIAVFLYRDLA